tara:strand:- start:9449 stop:9988 length:540 start_codon:yes stop_codon:yes gene_type:complete
MKKRNEYMALSGLTTQNIDMPQNWENYISIRNYGNLYLHINLEFFIDYPKIDTHSIIITENNKESHYQIHIENNKYDKTTIQLSTKQSLTIDERIFDEMRKHNVEKNGVIISVLRNAMLLRFPININNIYLDDIYWVCKTLDNIDKELMRIYDMNPSRQNDSSRTIISNDSNYLLYNDK